MKAKYVFCAQSPAVRLSIIAVVIAALLTLVAVSDGKAQCIDTADFYYWLEPFHTEKNWEVEGATSVTQLVEIFPPVPSFFVSDEEYLNVKISFDVVSRYAGDNDFIGFVLGYRNPFTPGSTNYEFLLFDWKASDEVGFGQNSFEGFTLSDFHGVIATHMIPDYFWGHRGLTGNSIFRVWAHKFGDNLGWETGQTYHFDVWYTESSIIVEIDGTRIFSVPRCNQAGRIGFYTYSQYLVTYSNLTISQAADLMVEPEEICAGDEVMASIESSECPGYNPAMASWIWDWGDGSQDQNLVSGSHQYTMPGIYTVNMIATFSNGCQDTVSQTVTVRENPLVDLGPDTLLPVYSTITLVAGPDQYGWSYQWSTGGVMPWLTLTELDRDTLVGVWVTKGQCQSYDEILIRVFEDPPEMVEFWMPNAFSPDGDGRNDFFLPVLHEELNGTFVFHIYDRWGTEIFSTDSPRNGWDGKYRGKACPGDVYVYLIKYFPPGQHQGGSTVTRRGSFLLLR